MGFFDSRSTPHAGSPIESLALRDEPIERTDDLEHRDIGVIAVGKDDVNCPKNVMDERGNSGVSRRNGGVEPTVVHL